MVPKVRLTWRNDARENANAKAEGRKALRTAYIQFRWVLRNADGSPIVDEDGHPRTYRPQKSIGLRTPESAEVVRATIADALARLDRNPALCPANLSPDQFFDWLKRGGELANGVVLSTETLGEVIADYNASIVDNTKAIGTRKTEGTHCRHLKRIIGEKTAFASIDARALRRYVQTRHAKDGVRGVTIGKELQTFATLWQHAKGNGWVSGDVPSVDVPKDGEKREFLTLAELESILPNTPEAEQAELWECCILEPHDIAALLEYVKHSKRAVQYPFIVPLFALPLLTGCRRGEVLRSLRTDFNFERRFVRIRETKKKKSKSASTRRVDLSDQLADIMRRWFDVAPPSQYTICYANGSPLTTKAAWYNFKATLKGSRFENLRGYHAFRHSIISIAAMNGTPEAVLREWVGHIDPETTRRYTHLIPSNARKAMDSLAELFAAKAMGENVSD